MKREEKDETIVYFVESFTIFIIFFKFKNQKYCGP